MALGDAVAHCGHAARKLGDRSNLARRLFDQLWKTLERLVGRKQVVIRRDDADVGLNRLAQDQFVLDVEGGAAVRQVGARQPVADWRLLARLVEAREILLAAA